jgi:hypothetical protein
MLLDPVAPIVIHANQLGTSSPTIAITLASFASSQGARWSLTDPALSNFYYCRWLIVGREEKALQYAHIALRGSHHALDLVSGLYSSLHSVHSVPVLRA